MSLWLQCRGAPGRAGYNCQTAPQGEKKATEVQTLFAINRVSIVNGVRRPRAQNRKTDWSPVFIKCQRVRVVRSTLAEEVEEVLLEAEVLLGPGGLVLQLLELQRHLLVVVADREVLLAVALVVRRALVQREVERLGRLRR